MIKSFQNKVLYSAKTVTYNTVRYRTVLKNNFGFQLLRIVNSNHFGRNFPSGVPKSVLCGPNVHKDYIFSGRGNNSLRGAMTFSVAVGIRIVLMNPWWSKKEVGRVRMSALW